MQETLVDLRIVLHIKLGLMKQFVKILNQKEAAFEYFEFESLIFNVEFLLDLR